MTADIERMFPALDALLEDMDHALWVARKSRSMSDLQERLSDRERAALVAFLRAAVPVLPAVAKSAVDMADALEGRGAH